MFSGCRWEGMMVYCALEREVIPLAVNMGRRPLRQNLGSVAHCEGICEQLGLVSLGEWFVPHFMPFVNKGALFQTDVRETWSRIWTLSSLEDIYLVRMSYFITLFRCIKQVIQVT